MWMPAIRVDFDSCKTTLEKPTQQLVDAARNAINSVYGLTAAEQKIAKRGIDLSNSTDSLEQSVIKQIVNEQKIQHEGDPRFMCTRINKGVRVEYYSPAEYRKLCDKIQNMKGDLRLMPVGEMNAAIKYLTWDDAHTRKLYDKIQKEKNKAIYDSMIQQVIFNPPATIVFWRDGSKTVVKCGENDIFDPEKGLAMAISKRAFGDNRDYYEVFAKWVGKYEYQQKRKEKK